jgi:hypothetical protein
VDGRRRRLEHHVGPVVALEQPVDALGRRLHAHRPRAGETFAGRIDTDHVDRFDQG